jgi:hypothetical protein
LSLLLCLLLFLGLAQQLIQREPGVIVGDRVVFVIAVVVDAASVIVDNVVILTPAVLTSLAMVRLFTALSDTLATLFAQVAPQRAR